MAGGHMKYRHLSRSSAHRQALLRNLVTSLFKHESIATTWHKAKEAQRLADQLVTLGKKNTEATRRRARQIFYEPDEMVPKLFGPIRERYATRPGGYTRVLRIEPLKEDQAESAILELVDGPRDLRFAMTAKTLARIPENAQFNEKTAENVKKVTQFREAGMDSLRDMVSQLRLHKDMDNRILPPPRKVYPEPKMKREMHYYEETDLYRLPNPVSKVETTGRTKTQEVQPEMPRDSHKRQQSRRTNTA
ncbi:ribosomal protein L17 [Paraphoma chrysanthemicola]|uniref:Large ribosomal subunit protein bL17m n=1 Tax=Paraphoma chrysanthemicola TaxID=798071 RepID=A0A8K0W413_9PLEO|nr:ribosomal protein L17 [Paraphoma chrysanthemicola]